MAKALLGHIPPRSGDRRMAAEVAFLRSRVRELEAELVSVRAERSAGVALAEPERIAARRAESPAMV